MYKKAKSKDIKNHQKQQNALYNMWNKKSFRPKADRLHTPCCEGAPRNEMGIYEEVVLHWCLAGGNNAHCYLPTGCRPGESLARHAHVAHLRGGLARFEPAVRSLRDFTLQLSLHTPDEPDRCEGASRLARRFSRERISEMLCAAGYRRPYLYLRRQDQRQAHVLCQSIHQEGADWLSRRLGRIRRGV